jgi:hypothetical protein
MWASGWGFLSGAVVMLFVEFGPFPADYSHYFKGWCFVGSFINRFAAEPWTPESTVRIRLWWWAICWGWAWPVTAYLSWRHFDIFPPSNDDAKDLKPKDDE